MSEEKQKILIVEDEEQIARFIELELSHEGYDVEKAVDGRTGLELALNAGCDLILLDIMLPELSGLEVLRRLRKVSDVPVIILTARDAVMDKVSGLDMGANDYITKPFAIEELLARIRVTLRDKIPLRSEKTEPETNGEIITSESGLEVNVNSHEIKYNGVTVEMTNREFILLKCMLENKGVAMSREKLLDIAWGYNYVGETNIVDVYVRYIRQKTDDSVIKTVRGVGYMIN